MVIITGKSRFQNAPSRVFRYKDIGVFEADSRMRLVTAWSYSRSLRQKYFMDGRGRGDFTRSGLGRIMGGGQLFQIGGGGGEADIAMGVRSLRTLSLLVGMVCTALDLEDVTPKDESRPW